MILLHHKGSKPEEIPEEDARILIGNTYSARQVAEAMESLRAGERVEINAGNYLERKLSPEVKP